MTGILGIGDIHDGSYSGVMPEIGIVKDAQSGDEIEVKPSRTQRKIIDEWFKMRDTLGKIDLVIVNGETCDGPARKSEGLNQWTTDKRSQALNTVELLKTLRCNHFHFTWGSKYHVEENMNLDQYVADQMTNPKLGRPVDAEYAPRFIQHDTKSGLRIHVQHYLQPSKATWQYLTTPLARDMVLLKLNDSRKKYGEIDIVIRSHVHFYTDVGYSASRGIILPCWQGPTPYDVMKGIITPPEIGYVTIDTNDDGTFEFHHSARPVVSSIKVFED